MNFFTKRQKFANEKRQKHRQQIFKRQRNLYINQIKSQGQGIGSINKNTNISSRFNSIASQSDKNGQMVPQSILNITQVTKKVPLSQLPAFLSPLPKWISSLSSPSVHSFTSLLPQSNHLIPLVSLCQQTLSLDQSPSLVLAVTNILAQITGLPTKILEKFGIEQKMLAKQFIEKVCGVIRKMGHSKEQETIQKQYKNDGKEFGTEQERMEIIINCVYVCGNLDEWTDYQVRIGIIRTLEIMCSKYQNYQQTLDILFWYAKNCLVNSQMNNNQLNSKAENKKKNIMEQKDQKTYDEIQNYQLQHQITKVTFRSIVSICCSIIPSKSDQKHKKSLEQLLPQSLKIYYLLTSQQSLYSSPHFAHIITLINQSLESILSILAFLPCPSSPSPSSPESIMTIICQILQQIILYLTSVHNFISFMPTVITKISILAVKGEIINGQALRLCGQFFQICVIKGIGMGKVNQSPMESGIGVQLQREFVRNLEKSFSNQAMTTNQDYRMGYMQLFNSMLDSITLHQLKTINSSSMQMVSQLPIPIGSILPIVQLLLSSPSSSSCPSPQPQILGMKILLKLSTNWQLNKEHIRYVLTSLNIHQNLYQLQQQKNQEVYGSALDVIEEYQLDQYY